MAAQQHAPESYTAFLTLALAGLRIGEALALTWDKLDFNGQTINIDRQLLGSIKGNGDDAKERLVDMADTLRDTLLSLNEARTRRSKVASFPQLGANPTAQDEQRVEKAFRRLMIRLCEKAGIPRHTPHALRHSYGSMLVSSGESLAYVRDQMGHASIQITVDTYGSWLPMGNRDAANRLASSYTGAEMVTRKRRTA